MSGAVVALGAAMVIMRSEPNARYVYAALPLLSVPFAALLGWLDGRQRWLARVLVCYVIACTALNAYFIPSSSYYHKDFSMRSPLSRAERERYMAYTAPVRLVIAYCNRAHPRAAVLITSGSDIAGLTGEVYENHWHQFATLDQIRKTLDMAAMLKLVEGWGVRYFIARKPAAGDYARPPALRELLETCTTPEYEAGDFYLARLEPDCGERVKGAAARAASRPEIVVPPGYYDDFDPAIRYRGDWTNSDKFDGPFQHTISFSDIPGAEAAFAFEGNALVYMYTKAPNRGLAAITIDGAGEGNHRSVFSGSRMAKLVPVLLPGTRQTPGGDPGAGPEQSWFDGPVCGSGWVPGWNEGAGQARPVRFVGRARPVSERALTGASESSPSPRASETSYRISFPSRPGTRTQVESRPGGHPYSPRASELAASVSTCAWAAAENP